MPGAELLMVGLAFAGLAGLIVHWGNDDDATQTEVEPQDETPPDSDDATDQTTDDNDTILSFDPDLIVDGTLSTGEGDDLVQLGTDTPQDIIVDLGDGNDTLNGTLPAHSTIIAGPGDDLLTVDDADLLLIEAGEGDDLIILKDPRDVSVYGDAGEDTIRVDMATITDDPTGSDVIWMFDDDGSDIYEFALKPIPERPEFLPIGYPYAGIIYGFESGQDKLVIDPTTYAGEATYEGHFRYSEGSTGYLHIVFEYSYPGQDANVFTSIAFVSSTVDDEDIEIVSALPDRPA